MANPAKQPQEVIHTPEAVLTFLLQRHRTLMQSAVAVAISFRILIFLAIAGSFFLPLETLLIEKNGPMIPISPRVIMHVLSAVFGLLGMFSAISYTREVSVIEDVLARLGDANEPYGTTWEDVYQSFKLELRYGIRRSNRRRRQMSGFVSLLVKAFEAYELWLSRVFHFATMEWTLYFLVSSFLLAVDLRLIPHH